ncbi:MAG TPA: hypothetical protein VNT52_05430 [Acidimicrobiales bacterium]|nr:hypothetical protein [Acidimicrobiales bacterium]
MPVPSRTAPALAGALTLGAGLAHAVAAVDHAGHGTAAVLFALAAAAQVVIGVALVLRPSPRVLAGGMAVNLAAAAAWALSRTTGLPVLGHETVGAADVATAVAELVAVVAAGVALGSPSVARRRLSPALVLAVVPAVVGLAVPSAHEHVVAGELAGGHAHAGDGHAHVPASKLAADPVFSGADTSHASAEELQAAKRLIETTRAAVAAKFPDQAALLAAGYRSIGDGLVTPFDHFIKPEYLQDGRELDPERVESVVMERTPAGWRVASAMYILEDGKTMADVPDVAGGLTVWHDHQNLCWDRSGLRLAGLLVNGRCFPGGTLRATPPMLHVWLADHPCGPFAGIEGHGGGCAHGHPN